MYWQRRRSPILLILFLLILVVIAAIFLLTRRTEAAVGPPVALCPGPDLYGYTCASGAGFAYVDATIDTQLYMDDGVTALALPFPFIFYGTTYEEVRLSSNGNLQFGNENPFFLNECLTAGPAVEMGDMVAPYWDDLDLTFYGYLEYDTIGTAPNRIFVIEWDDIPPFQGAEEDGVTFEVQLFEGSNNIVFLYEDVTALELSNGRSATIGLQSENQAISLQYGCNQPVVTDASGLYFAHPAEANEDVGQETVIEKTADNSWQAKGDVAILLEALQREGPEALTQLRAHWLSQAPSRISEWRWADVIGDGRNELVFLWRGTGAHPELAQLSVLTPDATGDMTLLLDHYFSSRQESLGQMSIAATADLTQDDQPDILLHEQRTGQIFLLSAHKGTLELLPLPERCTGSLAVVDTDEDGRLEIARDGCVQGRLLLSWNGRTFITK